MQVLIASGKAAVLVEEEYGGLHTLSICNTCTVSLGGIGCKKIGKMALENIPWSYCKELDCVIFPSSLACIK